MTSSNIFASNIHTYTTQKLPVFVLCMIDSYTHLQSYHKQLLTIAVLFCRPLQLILIFLLVWYYCTLTIRESILKVNGSRIKGWWRLHHFISTVVAGILLIWPQNEPWNEFRHTFMWFNAYISEQLFFTAYLILKSEIILKFSTVFSDF